VALCFAVFSCRPKNEKKNARSWGNSSATHRGDRERGKCFGGEGAGFAPRAIDRWQVVCGRLLRSHLRFFVRRGSTADFGCQPRFGRPPRAIDDGYNSPCRRRDRSGHRDNRAR
jgi:hypothetical protein